ncbi:MAG TPA: glycosyltransferase family 2 protein [Chitinophagaceae bacterium]|nr:glycosyltransferase family 2 protein [Chitinophagaceae bacterium]
MQPLSVVIITYNEEHNIGRCIDSVKTLADEIIVLDSYSTDKTIQVAQSHGAIVHREKFRGYIGQKNYAMQLATHNYILSLDADEALDEELRVAILEAKKDFPHRAYRMNRCTNYCGRFMHHGLWYPDKKIRLFDRRIAKWGGLNPHDKIELREGFTYRHLKGNILHYAFDTTEDLIWRNNRISSIAAMSLYNAGRRSNWYKMLVRPTWAFVNGYFLRLGFLDGFEGFSFAVNTSHQVFLKYSKLYKLQRSSRQKKAGSSASTRLTTEKKSAVGEG